MSQNGVIYRCTMTNPARSNDTSGAVEGRLIRDVVQKKGMNPPIPTRTMPDTNAPTAHMDTFMGLPPT